MKVAIVSDELLKVINVVKANSLSDVFEGIVAESWMAPNVEYTIEDGVRTPIPPTLISIEELIESCDEKRNTITENNILIGFDWPPSGGVRFYMSQENQINFSNLYQLSVQDLLSYPKTIWSGIDTMQLVDKQAVQDFYLAGVTYIELQLNQGLLAKQAFRTMSYTELTQWLIDHQ